MDNMNEELYHHGVKGMKWGIINEKDDPVTRLKAQKQTYDYDLKSTKNKLDYKQAIKLGKMELAKARSHNFTNFNISSMENKTERIKTRTRGLVAIAGLMTATSISNRWASVAETKSFNELQGRRRDDLEKKLLEKQNGKPDLDNAIKEISKPETESEVKEKTPKVEVKKETPKVEEKPKFEVYETKNTYSDQVTNDNIIKETSKISEQSQPHAVEGMKVEKKNQKSESRKNVDDYKKAKELGYESLFSKDLDTMYKKQRADENALQSKLKAMEKRDLDEIRANERFNEASKRRIQNELEKEENKRIAEKARAERIAAAEQRRRERWDKKLNFEGTVSVGKYGTPAAKKATEDALAKVGSIEFKHHAIPNSRTRRKSFGHSDIEENIDTVMHAGIKDMKKGVNRWRNPDGTLNDEGFIRYYGHPRRNKIPISEEDVKVTIDKKTQADLNAIGNRVLKDHQEKQSLQKRSGGNIDPDLTREQYEENVKEILIQETLSDKEKEIARTQQLINAYEARGDKAIIDALNSAQHIPGQVSQLVPNVPGKKTHPDYSDIPDDELIRRTNRIINENKYAEASGQMKYIKSGEEKVHEALQNIGVLLSIGLSVANIVAALRNSKRPMVDQPEKKKGGN